MLEAIADVDRDGTWELDGAHDLVHWVLMRYGLPFHRAHRMLLAARRLPELPALAAVLGAGVLGIDKVGELCRFATAKDQAALVAWAQGVSVGRIRERADAALRREAEETALTHRARSLCWWHEEEGRVLAFSGSLPAAEGAVVVRAIEREAARIPALPGERGPVGIEARRADALVSLACGSRAPRTELVVHVGPGVGAGELEGGGIAEEATIERLGCEARLHTVAHEAPGRIVALATRRRSPTAAMTRLLRHRDRGCRFPGCNARRFTQAHHIVFWSRGGRTELSNLVLTCWFHHTLVHEHGWRLVGPPQDLRWYRPDGTRYRAGPAPPG